MAPRQVLDGIQGCSGRASFDGEELLPQVLEGLETGQLPQQLQRKRSELCCCASLEAACQALDVGRIADAQRHLAAAERCLGVSSEVTGKREASVLLSRACFLFAITQAFLQQGCKVVSGLSGKVTMGMQGCHRNQEPAAPVKAGFCCRSLGCAYSASDRRTGAAGPAHDTAGGLQQEQQQEVRQHLEPRPPSA